MARLRRADCSAAGIRRVGRGRGFSYEEVDGTTISDREVIDRINELAIPPAWREVWICPHPNGHIQATGIDAAGRKQYLYHPQWRENRDREKFAEMERFAKSLPAMREQTEADLGRRGLVRERVLGCAVRLLDLGFFRIGSERYTEENETFGLSTLRRKHVEVSAGVASFHYKAKGSLDHNQEIADPVIVPTIKALKDRDGGGYELLAYREGRSGWADVKAAEINEYLKAVTGGDYSAKDFRTWNATVLAAVELAANGTEAKTEAARSAPPRRPPSGSPPTSRTPRRCVARPTSTRASSTATTRVRRSGTRCGGWWLGRTPASSSTASESSAPSCGCWATSRRCVTGRARPAAPRARKVHTGGIEPGERAKTRSSGAKSPTQGNRACCCAVFDVAGRRRRASSGLRRSPRPPSPNPGAPAPSRGPTRPAPPRAGVRSRGSRRRRRRSGATRPDLVPRPHLRRAARRPAPSSPPRPPRRSPPPRARPR